MEKIKVDVLEKVFEKIIAKLKFEDITEIELPYDFYRIIPSDSWEYSKDLDGDKTVSDVGSLSDDNKWIIKLANDDRGICTYVDFDRVASLLRIISEVRNPI